MRTKNRRAEMGIWSLIVVLLISSTASLKKKCPSNILKKFLSDPSKAKEHYDNGETINVTCLADSGDDGYDYPNYDGSEGLDTKNIRVLKCTDGKWIGHYPGCFSNCSKPDIYATLNPEYDVYAPGDNVTVTACKKDKARIEGDTTLICMADGTWKGSARCPKQHMSCNEQPPTISNAYRIDVVLDEYKHGTVLQYKCSQAFDQMGKYSVRCHDGQWIPDSASRISCIIGHCSHIYSRDIGNMRVKNISGQVGTYAEFECYDGYELDGSAKILCMADRKWYPEIPKCKPISCPPPKQILHGSLIQEAYNGLLNIYQSTIRYDCDQGYRIVGLRFRKCQSDRTWSGNDTKCEEIVCEKPSPPDNGKVYLTDNTEKVGSQIEYICDENHIMEPITSQFAICTVHGHWSNPQPRCIKICRVRALSHGLLYEIFGRKITENSYVLDNTELIFTCYNGYEKYANGYETQGRLKCVDGAMHPGAPECRPKRCFIEPPINLEYFIGQEKVLEKYIHSGIEMNARCSNRTELFRSASYVEREQVPVKCNFGILEPGSLVCQDKRCNIITTIDNGHFINRRKVVVRGEKIHSGSNIQLKCFEGYELYNKTYSMYLKLVQIDIKCYQGSFTPEIPSCEPKRCFIEPPINLEYFIGQEKVLEKYIHSGIEMNARCSNRTELFRSASYVEREQVPVKCNFGILEPGSLVCQDKRCNIVTRIENGHFRNRGNVIVTGEKIHSGSNIQLKCFEGYELYNKTYSMYLKLVQIDIKCYQGSFTPEIPSCEPKRCFIEPRTNLEYFIGQEKVFGNYIHSGIEMNARCSNRTELYRSASYVEREQVSVKCNFGKLEPALLVCQDRRCSIITTIDNGLFINRGNVVVTGEKINSGSNIKLICFEGYQLYNKTNSMYLDLEQTDIMCYQGSFPPEIPSCEPKRCLIEPPVNMEYFIEGNKVLHKYIDNGTGMQARCPDRMELVLSSSFLDNETFVQCILGILEPRTLECMGKRCNITQIENGKLENGGIVIGPRELIGSNSNITLVCYDGFELYNESISMYLESAKTDILCYQGSFNVAFPKCNPKRCRLDRSLFLLPEVHYVQHGQNLTVHCPDNMELHREGNHQKLEETSMFCSKGIWTPAPPMCIKKSCKPPVLTEAITEFVAKGNKSTPENYFPHDQSVEAVCKDGYRQQGTFTCQEGIWMGNSTCEPEVCNGPEFQFIVVNNGTLGNEGIIFSHGTKLNASCDSSYTLHADEGSGGNGTLTECIHGEWKPKFSCKHMCKTIDVAREISGFIVSETKTTPGEFVPHNQSIEIVCGEGYRPHGIITCNSGIWMGNSTCELDVKGCVLKDPGMHFISLGDRTVLNVGENANVSCKFGYQIVPNISAKSTFEYDYGDSESTANPSEMSESEDNENLIAVSDGNYTCRDSGKWEPELRFSCKQIVCDSFDRVNLENGDIFYSTHSVKTVGTVASFQCNPGYFRHGSETRTCQIDGTWSGECVTCQMITRNISMTCPAPCVPEGARKTGSHSYEIGSIVKLNCPRSKTQDRDDRSNIRHCIKIGEYASWNGTNINCKEIICDKGDHYGFENGRVTYSTSVATVGTVASFMCYSGYNRHGPKTRNCQKDGTWSGGCVKCQKHQHNSSTCPAPCVPDGAKKIGSLSYEIGSRIQFYCLKSNMNFSVENSYIRHCVNDGKSASWNGTDINCKAKCKPLTDTYNVVQTGVVPGILSDKTVVELNCNGSQVQGECRKGQWHPKKPTCKYTCPLSAVKGTLYNYKLTNKQVFHGPIESGRQIKVTCEDGFVPNTHNYDVSNCVNGVWTPEIVKCEKRGNF